MISVIRKYSKWRCYWIDSLVCIVNKLQYTTPAFTFFGFWGGIEIICFSAAFCLSGFSELIRQAGTL